MVHHPVIVIGVPVHNEETFLEATLASIAAQTHADFRVLVSDNASTDATPDIIRRFADHDARFVHQQQAMNIGAAANFDFVRTHSESPHFAWIGGHDLVDPDYLRIQLACLRNHPLAAVAYSFPRIIDRDGNETSRRRDVGTAPSFRHPMVRYLWSVACGAELGPVHGLFRRSMLPSLPLHACAACDHVLLSNALRLGSFVSVPEHLYALRDLDLTPRASTTMQRITGQAGARPDSSATIAAYLADFDAMSADRPGDQRWRPLLEWILNDRFGPRRVRFTKWLRTGAKRVHSIRRLLGSRSL